MNRILLVEDDDDLRVLLHEMLEKAGYEIESARNGTEALALNYVEPATLVITDMFMPKMDGLQTIIELRKDNPKLEFLAISGCSKDSLTLAKKAGARATLTKPFSAEKLLHTVSRLVGCPRHRLRPSFA